MDGVQFWVSVLFYGWCPILVTAPELQEDLLGTEVKKVALAPVIYSYNSRLDLVPQDILVMAPKLQEDWLGTRMK